MTKAPTPRRGAHLTRLLRWLCRRAREDAAVGHDREDGHPSAASMELVGRLAAGMSHDLNNLLAVVLSGCESLEEALSPSHPQRQGLADVRSAAEQGALLTRYVLAFLRGELGPKRLMDVVSLARGSSRLLGSLLGHRVKIILDLPQLARPVLGHPERLQQVLLNLAANARDAMPEGGVLTVEVRDVPASDPILHRRAGGLAGPHVLLAITDTGTGIEERISRELFEPLFTTKPLGRGTGLGLSIVRDIVAETGGLMEVFTRPGVGTRFEIYLPAAEDTGSRA